VSAWLHGTMRVGDTLKIAPPRNDFPSRRRRRTLLLAGGAASRNGAVADRRRAPHRLDRNGLWEIQLRLLYAYGQGIPFQRGVEGCAEVLKMIWPDT
jgi:hypothetical protein